MLRQIRLPGVSNNIAPGANLIVEVKPGPTFHTIWTVLTSASNGLDMSDVEKITVNFDGKPVMSYTDLQTLFDNNAYWGRPGDSMAVGKATFGLHFFRGELRQQWQRLGGIGTFDLSRFHLEFKLSATAPADLKVECFADVDTTIQKVGAYWRVTEYPTAATVAGENEIDKLPRNTYLAALHFKKSDVSAIDIEGDSLRLLDGTKDSLELRCKNAAPKARAPVTARYTHADFIIHGEIGDTIDLYKIRDLRVKYTVGATGAITIIAEHLDALSEQVDVNK